MEPAEEKPAKPSWADRVIVTPEQWENDPGACAVKFALLTVAILAMGHLAPLVAIGAGLVIVGKAVRS